MFDAEDTINQEPTTTEQKVIIASLGSDHTGRLAYRTEVAVGMQAMVTLNLATEADLANGSRGVIHSIVLDPRETASDSDRDEEGVVKLQYPPAMIMFKPFHYEFAPFPGLEPGLIPIFPSEAKFNIHYRTNPKTQVYRRQYAMVAAYAFTDHKAQGQTLGYAIVDIGPTRRFPVDPFAAYVALSRSRGRGTIRLLRHFDPGIFTQHPSEALRVEDGRLATLAKKTAEKFDSGFYSFM